MSIKKRLVLGAAAVATVGAVATLVAGVTFGIFSATPVGSGSNLFTAGTVSIGTPASTTCTIGPIEPGDSTTGWSLADEEGSQNKTPCTFQVTYTGTLGAFVGLVATTGGTGLWTGTALSTPPATNGATAGLQIAITDGNSTSYTTTADVLNDSGGAVGDPLYVGDEAGGAVNTFTVNYLLPLETANALQGKTLTLTFTLYAVQDSNNGTGCATKGVQCGTITAWS
jgi:hypothetical protein